tara:strand:+ start:4801 stop:5454 length:654 start_codon:yes stop_codon:yes gene_type:complete
MMIVGFGYRDWALNIYFQLQKLSSHKVIIIKERGNIDFSFLDILKPDFVLFYGWSWKLPSEVVSTHKCLMLHPSDLPKYRGGSPIQNQILNGILESKLTIFQVTNEIDAGPILIQRPLSLKGEMSEIFGRLEQCGLEATNDILKGEYEIEPQDNSKASYYSRRNPSQSEITFEELRSASALEIYNKVRCLQDPYPNAFIRMSDGLKLHLKSVIIDGD